MGAASRVVSSRSLWCLAYLCSECYAFLKSLVYAILTHTNLQTSSSQSSCAANFTGASLSTVVLCCKAVFGGWLWPCGHKCAKEVRVDECLAFILSAKSCFALMLSLRCNTHLQTGVDEIWGLRPELCVAALYGLAYLHSQCISEVPSLRCNAHTLLCRYTTSNP
jgi:hypothetical protein